jgi:hypothetical protein
MRGRASIAAAALALALALAACGGSGGSGSSPSTPSTEERLTPQGGIVFPIHPRPPRSQIKVAQHELRQVIAGKRSPGSLPAVIRRLEFLTDTLYQVGRCGEYELDECNWARWEKLAAKIARQTIFWGFGVSTSGREEPSAFSLRRTLIEKAYHRQGRRHGFRTLSTRTWGRRLLALEERTVGQCKGIPTCPYEKYEARIAKLERQMDFTPATAVP